MLLRAALCLGVCTHAYRYAVFGALLFCGFIIFDTWRLLEKGNVDDYLLLSIELYLDIINLFLFVLDLLSPNR